jgi:hypothetical protein
LATIYAKGLSVPFVSPPELLDLDGTDPAKSQKAGEYILALFEQSWADETNGRTEWRALPFWGGGSDNPARIFRGNLADAFKTAAAPNALPAALWLIEHDLVEDNIAAGAQVLSRIHGAVADAAIGTILEEQHPSQQVLIMALQEAAARHLTQDKQNVIALEQSYHSAVRKAAQGTALQLGEAHVKEYDRSAPLSPRIIEFLKNNSERMMTPVPSQAIWQEAGSASNSTGGWLLQETKFQWCLLDYFAREDWILKFHSQLRPGTLSGVAEDLIARRSKIMTLQAAAKDNQDDSNQSDHERAALSWCGILSGQFEPRFISLPEITVAVWCWQRGDLDHCRGLLDPCYSSADDDRWLDWAARDYLGNHYHRDMINTYCNDQDFPATLAIAKHISQPVFDGYDYQDRAKELASQLTRSDAVTASSLPSLPVWSILQICLSRDAQITYLARRLKFFHVEPTMEPGSISYDDPEPFSLTGLYCINPYQELKRMNLTGHDLKALAPFVADRDFMLTYSYGRSWSPGWTLHRVNWAVQKIVNDIAGQPAPRVGTIQELLDGTEPKPKEILSHDDDGPVYFTANPSGDVVQDFKAWADAQPARGFWASWWQTPIALFISFLIIRRYLKRLSFEKMPLKSLIFIFFLISMMTAIFNGYSGNSELLSGLSNLANEIAKIFCWVWVVRIILLLCRKWSPKPREAQST